MNAQQSNNMLALEVLAHAGRSGASLSLRRRGTATKEAEKSCSCKPVSYLRQSIAIRLVVAVFFTSTRDTLVHWEDLDRRLLGRNVLVPRNH